MKNATDTKQLSFFDLPGWNGGQGESVQQELFTPEELKKLRTKKKTKPIEVNSRSEMRRLKAQGLNVKVKNEKGSRK